MTGSQISHDLYKYVPLGLLETYKLLLVLYEILELNTWQKITKTTKEELDKKSPQHPQRWNQANWIIISKQILTSKAETEQQLKYLRWSLMWVTRGGGGWHGLTVNTGQRCRHHRDKVLVRNYHDRACLLSIRRKLLQNIGPEPDISIITPE